MIDKLKQIDDSKLPGIWCSFNKWEIPDELIEFKPVNWELLPMQLKHEYIRECIVYIKSKVSEKELSREWNKDRMVGIEFDVWWENKKPLSDLAKSILKSLVDDTNSNLN